MKKLYAALATASLLAMASSAWAAEPMKLTNGQMDSVTAGGIGGLSVVFSAAATGSLVAATMSAVPLATAVQTALPVPPLPPGLPSQLTVTVSAINGAAD